MNSGPVGDGLSYWAHIKISGKLTARQLKAVTRKINAAIKAPGVKGRIVAHARVSDNAAQKMQLGYRK